MSDDERAVRGVMSQWMAASSAGDVETVLRLMADDAVFLLPGREPFGKQEFAAQARAMRDVKLEGSNDVEELRVLGDWAFCISRVTVKVVSRDGTSSRRSGRTLSLFRRASGSWVLARDANLMTGQ
ncbi:MAG TPA: SgcJ/EcaC family oxidoreductase [Anaeromyxobacteraceae bacterium]|nr:SgcJ/EcaC family oxidoreductase [Anaeromyxobacteraceae bacterium]